MSTTTCLDRIYEIKRRCFDNESRFKQLVRMEFGGCSIIADWGNKRTYQVEDVDFECTPTNTRFIWNNREVTVAEYFQTCYSKNVTDFNQPCFLVKVGEQ